MSVLLNLSFFSGAKNLSCRHLQRVDLLEGSAGRRQDGDEDGLAFFADLIAVGVLDFSNEPVSLQQSEFSADGGGPAAALGIRGRWGTVQQSLQISMAASVDQRVSMVDGRQ